MSATTLAEIKDWLQQGASDGARWMIVVCDTYDWEDYPVYCKTAEEAEMQLTALGDHEMTRVMEVYDYALPLEQQLWEKRAWHLPG